MKNFFEKAALKFQRFMQGRYGADRLYRVLSWCYLIIILASAIVSRHAQKWIYYTMLALGLAVFVYSFYRVFSKNIEKRRAENEKWLTFENGFKKRFRLLRDRWKFRKTHIFRKCPKCKSVLRLKRIKGTHTVECPHCKNTFKVRSL